MELKRTRGGSRRRYDLDDGYFSVPNQENCYWAGFIAADGCVSATWKNQVIITLSKKDRGHLKKFMDCVGSVAAIRDYTGRHRTHGEFKYSRVKITSSQVVSDLENNFSVTARKTFSYLPPNINDEILIDCFIAGYIDGDGTIDVKREQPRIRMLGTEAFLSWTCNYINKKFPPRWSNTGFPSRPRISKIGGRIFDICFSGKRMCPWIIDIQNYNLPVLERKWSFAFEFCERL